MQSLMFGSESLVNRIRRAILVADLRTKKKIGRAEAQAVVANYDTDRVAKDVGDRWKGYVTLLNLRNWQALEKRPVTEQIYVHSKLLVADDRVAILGSANINDRSQLGDRDSELAVVVRDDEQISTKLDGVHNDLVSLNVRNLRVRLWKKLFGLMGGAVPANSLLDVVGKPAARETWEAIQRVAHSNALAYKKAFPFLATIDGKPSSIWPTWDKDRRGLKSYMPFNERFWRDDEVLDEPFTWDAKSRVTEILPTGIEGFITALPVTWTEGENNSSGINLSMLANNIAPKDDGRTLASVNKGKGLGGAHEA
jgi:phospholipase D1/2